MKTTNSGFTLVEVLVAVAIVALAVTGILVAMMRQIDGTAYLRDKLFAHYVAQNQMELALLANAHTNDIPSDAFSGVDEMVGRFGCGVVIDVCHSAGGGFVEIGAVAGAADDVNAIAGREDRLSVGIRSPEQANQTNP